MKFHPPFPLLGLLDPFHPISSGLYAFLHLEDFIYLECYCLLNFQVGIGKDSTLYALVEGFVKFRSERAPPYHWCLGQQEPFEEKKYISVIPREPFKGPKLVPDRDVYRITP